jgi:hypothetical protein
MLELLMVFLLLSGLVLVTRELANGGRTPRWAIYPLFALALVSVTPLLFVFLFASLYN